MVADLEELLAGIRACRVCVETPEGRSLPHLPRPVIRAKASARIAVCGQAPGTRVHASGVPFFDPSGERLRNWMGVTAEEFYDDTRVAIVPMGFCFPGLDSHGSDLPPRRECAPLWHDRVMARLESVELVLLVGGYAMRWHLAGMGKATMTDTVRGWRRVYAANSRLDTRLDTRLDSGPRLLPLPHPSWRNNAWIKKNPWFEAELLVELRDAVRGLLGDR